MPACLGAQAPAPCLACAPVRSEAGFTSRASRHLHWPHSFGGGTNNQRANLGPRVPGNGGWIPHADGRPEAFRWIGLACCSFLRLPCSLFCTDWITHRVASEDSSLPTERITRPVLVPLFLIAGCGISTAKAGWMLVRIRLVAGCMSARGAGQGAVFVSSISAACLSVSRDQLPIAMAASNIVQRFGGPLGSTIMAIVHPEATERPVLTACPPHRTSRVVWSRHRAAMAAFPGVLYARDVKDRFPAAHSNCRERVPDASSRARPAPESAQFGSTR
jgi:hypothetical protein